MTRRNEIRAADDGRRLEIYLYGEIGGGWYSGSTSAESFAALMREYPDAQDIVLNINSPGGSFTEAIAIRALLQRHPARVVARIDALAASAASLVAMAAEEITIPPGAYMMIHNARTYTNGTASEHLVNAELLTNIDADMRDIYAARTGQNPEQVAADMAATTYFSAAQAVEYGLADRIDGDAVALAPEDVRGLTVPHEIRAAMRTNNNQRGNMDIIAMASLLGCAPTEDAVKAQLHQLTAKAALADDARAEAARYKDALAKAQAETLALQVAAKSQQAKAIVEALRAEGRVVAGSKTADRIAAAEAAGDVDQLEAIADMLREHAPAVPVGARQTTTKGAPNSGQLAPPPMANGKIDYDAVGAALPAEVRGTYAGMSWQLVLSQPAATALWEQAGFQVPA